MTRKETEEIFDSIYISDYDYYLGDREIDIIHSLENDFRSKGLTVAQEGLLRDLFKIFQKNVEKEQESIDF